MTPAEEFEALAEGQSFDPTLAAAAPPPGPVGPGPADPITAAALLRAAQAGYEDSKWLSPLGLPMKINDLVLPYVEKKVVDPLLAKLGEATSPGTETLARAGASGLGFPNQLEDFGPTPRGREGVESLEEDWGPMGTATLMGAAQNAPTLASAPSMARAAAPAVKGALGRLWGGYSKVFDRTAGPLLDRLLDKVHPPAPPVTGPSLPAGPRHLPDLPPQAAKEAEELDRYYALKRADKYGTPGARPRNVESPPAPPPAPGAPLSADQQLQLALAQRASLGR